MLCVDAGAFPWRGVLHTWRSIPNCRRPEPVGRQMCGLLGGEEPVLVGLKRPQEWCPVAAPFLWTGGVALLSVRCPCGALLVLWWSMFNRTSHDNLYINGGGGSWPAVG